MRPGFDLRHRHPRLWASVMTGTVEDFKARHVARATRATRAARLSLDGARQVDAECAQALVALPWGRAMTVLEAAIISADPAGHERRRAEAEQHRYVATSRRDTTTGLRTLIARTTAGDIARLEAMISHLADLLATKAGDTDDLQLRRTKAIGVLADPAAACLLLARPRPNPDAEPEPEPQPDAEPQAHVTAVDAARELGRLMTEQGATALARLRPRTVVYLHLNADTLHTHGGILRGEGIGPVALSDLHELLGRDTVVVTPVLDYHDQSPVDAYEVPRAMRDAIAQAHPYEPFPWGTLPSAAADYDHTIPYTAPARGGPPGQTRPDNLGPLARGHHNAKTHGGFQLHQPVPGVYLWRTPTGHWYQVDRHGTTPLGRPTASTITRRAEHAHSLLEVQLTGLLAG